MYCGDNRELFPWPNWGQGFPDAGWLYRGTINSAIGDGTANNNPPQYSIPVYNLTGSGKFESDVLIGMKANAIYQYCPNVLAWRCPLDKPGDSTTSWGSRKQQLSSYVMNPTCTFSKRAPNGGTGTAADWHRMKTTEVRLQDSILLWELDFRPNLTPAVDWSDGSNYPDTQGLGLAHRIGGIVTAVDGSSRFIKLNEYTAMSVQPPAGTVNQLWWQN